jgi:hypothetical protein
MIRIRQSFPATPAVDIRQTLASQTATLCQQIRPGSHIAVGVGSRGITKLADIVLAVLDLLRAAGASPFIIPAMGSHGGASPEGQAEILDGYGISEKAMGAPVRASLEVQQIGVSPEGVPAYCSTEALSSDGIILINRIKPHTDFFSDTLGSGLLKMSVIGLGKRTGAAAMHRAAMHHGYEPVIRGLAGVLLRKAPILAGVAIIENQVHETARLVVIPGPEIEAREPALLAEARQLMPALPFEEIDLLIIDRIGKNISGAGMDPNIIMRGVHGYSSMLGRDNRPAPFIRRIFVRDLTPETHGNAIGIGLADFTTSRLVRAMDERATFVNALTAMTPQGARIPIHAETDREIVDFALDSLALPDLSAAKIVRIADTLSLSEFDVSEALWNEPGRPEATLTAASPAQEMQFDAANNLL